MSDSKGYEVSVKEYAAQRNKTVQAVYQQMKRKENAAALDGHIVVRWVGNKKVKYLDEVAVSLLDAASGAAPLVYLRNEIEGELATAQQDLERMRFEVARREGQIELLKEQLAEKEAALRLLGESQSVIDAQEARIADLSRERDEEIGKRREAETSLETERTRPISFKEWWQRRKQR